MLSARDLLDRFRPVGAPGAAAPAGVPADRVAELSRELQPVFDELVEVQRQCAELRTAVAAEVMVRRVAGAARARAIVAAARLDAEAQRADEAARERRETEQESAATIAAAEREAAEIHRRAEERMDGHVAHVVSAVLHTIAAEPVEGRVR
jgi:dihydroxyacetone kinase